MVPLFSCWAMDLGSYSRLLRRALQAAYVLFIWQGYSMAQGGLGRGGT